MASTSIAQPQGEWVERKTELMEFKAPGDCVEGVIVSMGPREIADKINPRIKKRVMELVIREDSGEIKKILATVDISSKVFMSDMGKKVSIAYKGENPNVSKNGKNMREFDVRFFVPGGDHATSLNITDDDIPF